MKRESERDKECMYVNVNVVIHCRDGGWAKKIYSFSTHVLWHFVKKKGKNFSGNSHIAVLCVEIKNPSSEAIGIK